MNHPIFENVADENMAAACSEIFGADRDFKFAIRPELDKKYDNHDFPPEPSYFASVTAAYLEPEPTGGLNVRRQFASLDPKSVNPSAVADLYASFIGPLQEQPDMLHLLDPIEEAQSSQRRDKSVLQDWYLDRVVQTGGRLVTAHLVVVTASEKSLVDALVIPRYVHENISLFVRGALLEIKPNFDELLASDKFGAQTQDKMQESMRMVLTNEPVVKNLGNVVAASFLPEVDQMTRLLHTQPSVQPKPNRAERRKQRKNRG